MASPRELLAAQLGRLRLGVEPIEDQLARYRRATWALTAVPSILGVFFVTLFTVFGRPDIGMILVALVLLADRDGCLVGLCDHGRAGAAIPSGGRRIQPPSGRLVMGGGWREDGAEGV